VPRSDDSLSPRQRSYYDPNESGPVLAGAAGCGRARGLASEDSGRRRSAASTGLRRRIPPSPAIANALFMTSPSSY